MRTRTKYIIAIFLIVFLDFNWSFADSSAIDPYSFVEIPVYHKGYNVKQSVNHSKKTKSLSYHVQTDPPAAEVIEFYDAYLNGRGWRSSFEICQRNWGNSSDGSEKDGLSVRQLFASWRHHDLNLKLDLWLKHEMVDGGRRNDVVVHCLLQPLKDSKKIGWFQDAGLERLREKVSGYILFD